MAAEKEKESDTPVFVGEGPNNQHEVKDGCRGEGGHNMGGGTVVVLRGGSCTLNGR